MNDIKRCRCRCIFCFVDQLPPDLRPSLYIKDDDFLLSFMHSNFITLNNLMDKDIDKIIRSGLSPLYVSVHSLDPATREKIFRTGNHMRGLANLKKISEGGIAIHAQIVLCPGINDGAGLEATLEGLHRDFNIKSAGIVPVGITKYNRNDMLKKVGSKTASETIGLVERFNEKHLTSDLIFLSDEFYILAGCGFPPHEDYHTFPQIENGIGKSRDFISAFAALSKKRHFYNIKNILLLTSEYGAYVFNKLESELRSLNLNFNLMVIRNDFLGGNVRATALLSGADIIESLKMGGLSHFNKIIIPDTIFNPEGLTIDNFKKEDISKIDERVMFVGEKPKDLIGEL